MMMTGDVELHGTWVSTLYPLLYPNYLRSEVLNRKNKMEYREFGGIEITPDFVDELEEEWYENRRTMRISLEQYIRSNTGWTYSEYLAYRSNGRLPK